MRGTVAKRMRREAAAITAEITGVHENDETFDEDASRRLYRRMKKLYTRGATTTQ